MAVVAEPEPSDHREAEEVGEDLAPVVEQVVVDLVRAQVVRHRQAEHEQRDGDREDAVAERDDAIERAGLALGCLRARLDPTRIGAGSDGSGYSPYAARSSGSFSASISARPTITLHCFQVASSCILPSSMWTPRPSGIASITLLGEPDLLRVGREDALGDLDLARVQRPGADAAHQERGAELRLAALDVGDVAERAVEREDPGRRAGVDHARDRVVPQVLLRARRAAVAVGGRGRRARRSRGARRRRASSSCAATRRGRPGRSSCPACAARPRRSPRGWRRRARSRGSRGRGSGAGGRAWPRAARAAGRRSGCPTRPRPSGP